MPVIYLGCKNNSYKSGVWVRVNVTCEDYTCSKLFQRYTHKLTTPKKGCINVFKGSKGSGDYLTLINVNSYSSAKLQQVEVYFNKHDTSNTPLLFVLHFENGAENGSFTSRYYPRSKFETEMTGCATKKIDELCDYTKDSDILCPLIQESDVLSDVLMYDIMQRPNANGDGSKCTYNCDKINVEDATKTHPTLTSGFTRFKHTPKKNGDNGNNQSKKACVTYRCQALLNEGGDELDGVQGVTYTSVTVYFGTKAKRGCTDKCKAPCGEAATCTPGQGSACPPAAPTTPSGNTCTSQWHDVPLMIALQKQGSGDSNNNTDYYVHRRKASNGGDGRTGNGDQYYWVKLTLQNRDNGQENGLKQLLADIGFQTASNGLGTSSSVKSRLAQTPIGADGQNGQTNNLTLLLKRLEFDLTGSVVILLDYPKSVSSGQNGDYDDEEIERAIGTLGSGAKNGINLLKLNGGTKITLTDADNGQTKCLTNHKYRVVVHDFSKAVGGLGPGCSAGLRFLIPIKDGTAGVNGQKYAQLKLYSSATETDAQHLEYKYYSKNGGSNGAHTGTKVYVVFYAGTGTGGDRAGTDSDPRPLLLCYQKEVYRPKDKNQYDQTWVKVPGLTPGKCLCNNGVADTSSGPNETLLKAVTGVVGFLNQVQLQIHPGPSASAGAVQPCPNSGVSGHGSAVPATCQTTSTATNTCTYPVHTYNGSDIKVQVKCESVTTTTGTSGSKTCYRKLTHQPAGLNGKGATNGAKGFRLGDVAYCPNGDSGPKGKIDYYGNGAPGGQNGEQTATHKWAPLTSVHAYFYDQDTGYNDPLLVILEFSNGRDNDKECYKLTRTANGTGLEWEKDTEAKKLVDQGDALARHLDAIRYCLKKVVRIRLEYNGKTDYKLVGRDAKDGSTFNKQINSGKTQVEVCECKCDALTDSNYKCFRHGLTQALKDHQHEVAGLAFTLPGESGSVIEIPLAEGEGKCAVDGASQKLVGQDVTCPNSLTNGAKITYNQCMGDIYVYFYAHKGMGEGDNQTDTVPLMVKFNGHFYKPESRDNYFKKWECVKELTDVKGECGCSGGDSGGHGPDCSKLASELDKVNLALNQIDLDKSSKGAAYGLPENGQGGGTTVKVDKETFPTERIIVKQQTGPKQPPSTNAYTRVVHRTKNGFLIGEITYNQKNITSGITPNGQNGLGEATIKIANGGTGHKTLVTQNQCNTVVAYYSTTDKDKKLPQLIVILKTESPVDTSKDVKSSNGKYGYYVIYNGGSGPGHHFQYKWVDVRGKEASGVELNDETDFKLLNAAVLLVDQQAKTYGDEDIKKAIETANLKSPGNSEGVNRMTGNNRNITVTDETTSTDGGAVTHTCPCKCKCLKDAGFKVMTHDIKILVELSGFKSPLCDVPVITGLRFLIPSMYRENSYNEIKLCSNGSGTSCSMEDRHYYRNRENKICVYFYGSDPRPLLVCYDNWAYSPKTLNGYFTDWHKAEGVTKCGCDQTPLPKTCDKCPVVSELVRVSDFLNPVKLQIVPGNTKRYTIHWFNTKPIRIEVEEKKADGSFCYNRYTHKHYGIYGDGSGFRLGDIYYKQNCIKLNDASANTGTNKCISASQGKNDNEKCGAFPFVVVFYYKLDSERKNPIVVAMCKNSSGGTSTCPKLECNLYYILKDRAGKKYKKGSGTLTMDDPKKLGDQLDAALFGVGKHLRVVLAKRPVPTKYSEGSDDKKCKVMGLENGNDDLDQLRTCKFNLAEDLIKGNDEALLYHVGKKTQYQAQLVNGPSEPPSTQSKETVITVKEVECHKSYSDAGYRCFQHGLMNAQNIEQVGGLKLAVFDGPGKQGSAAEITLCTGDNTSGKNEQVQLSYTTCKGDLYVFFYGDDPRPLLLCYDDCAYCPKDMAGYCREWVRVTDTSGGKPGTAVKPVTCLCPQEPGGAAQQLLKALYDVSQFMNPVRLCLGKDAYQKLDPKHGQQQQQPVAPSGQSEGPKQWSYTIHAESRPPICVRVTGVDLRCYKQYVHRPAIHGFRLGRVTYAGAVDAGEGGDPGAGSVQGSPGQTATCTASQTGPAGNTGGACSPAAPGTPTTTTPYCFEYAPEKQLWSVSVYYYMYDKDHNWPLVVELGFEWYVLLAYISYFYALAHPDSSIIFIPKHPKELNRYQPK